MIATVVLNGYIRLAFSVIVAIALLWILLKFNAKNNPQESSLDMLEKRYLRGEISEEAFEEAKRRQGMD